MASDAGVWVKLNEASVSNNPGTGSNLLYNGAMQLAQRGTSATGITTSGYYTADRWRLLMLDDFGVWDESIEADAPEGFGQSLKILCTTADASPASNAQFRYEQILEGQDLQRIAKGTSSAKELTISFWVKSNVTGTYIVWLYDKINRRHVSGSYTVSASSTWEKKSITFPADLTGAFANNNEGALVVSLGLAVGSDWSSGTLDTSWADEVNANRFAGQTNLAAAAGNYFQVTGVQLECGETATEFEHKKYGTELAECQRYYQKSYHFTDYPGAAPSNGALVVVGMANTATTTGNHNAGFRFESRMRTTPTVTSYRADNGASGELMYARKSTPAAPATASVTRVTDTGAAIYTTNASGLVAGDAVELLFHYTAEAEL